MSIKRVYRPAVVPTKALSQREVKKMNVKELAEICESIMHSSKAELAAILADPHTPMIKVNLISAILTDSTKGLTYTLDKLLERVYGKPKTQIELSNDPDNPMNFSPVQIVVSLPKNDRESND
jgi:predicted thioredoxin/glutaredoxin